MPISPDVFIKVAERAGFVGEITRLVVRHVLQRFWRRRCANGPASGSTSISPLRIWPIPTSCRCSKSACRRPGFNRAASASRSPRATRRVSRWPKETILRLRQKGHFVHIDDFGTGYSSLAYLHDLSVDAIKIDKAFTKAIGTDAVTVSILPQILTMADTLDLRVVVEGIETPQQATYFAAARQIDLRAGLALWTSRSVRECSIACSSEDRAMETAAIASRSPGRLSAVASTARCLIRPLGAGYRILCDLRALSFCAGRATTDDNS